MRKILIFAASAVFCVSAAADGLTKTEKELARRVEARLDAATVAQWAIIFNPVLTGLADGVRSGLTSVAKADWGKLGNASRSMKRITACKIVEDIDMVYDVDQDDVSEVGRAYFARARSEFDRDC